MREKTKAHNKFEKSIYTQYTNIQKYIALTSTDNCLYELDHA